MCQKVFAQLISSVLSESVCGELGGTEVKYATALISPTGTLYTNVTTSFVGPSAGERFRYSRTKSVTICNSITSKNISQLQSSLIKKGFAVICENSVNLSTFTRSFMSLCGFCKSAAARRSSHILEILCSQRLGVPLCSSSNTFPL